MYEWRHVDWREIYGQPRNEAAEQQKKALDEALQKEKWAKAKIKKVNENVTDLIYNPTTDCWEPEIKLLEGKC